MGEAGEGAERLRANMGDGPRERRREHRFSVDVGDARGHCLAGAPGPPAGRIGGGTASPACPAASRTTTAQSVWSQTPARQSLSWGTATAAPRPPLSVRLPSAALSVVGSLDWAAWVNARRYTPAKSTGPSTRFWTKYRASCR